MELAKRVCNQRERPRSGPAASEGSHGGMERPAGAIYRPGKPKRSLFTAERSAAVNKDARSCRCMEMQATDVMSGQMPLREPHSGWGRKISRQHFALGDKSTLPHRGEQWRVPRAEHRAFIIPLWVGGWWRMAAVCRFFAEQSDQRSIRRPECRCLSLQVGKASGGFRVDSGVKRANTPTTEGWRRKART